MIGLAFDRRTVVDVVFRSLRPSQRRMPRARPASVEFEPEDTQIGQGSFGRVFTKAGCRQSDSTKEIRYAAKVFGDDTCRIFLPGSNYDGVFTLLGAWNEWLTASQIAFPFCIRVLEFESVPRLSDGTRSLLTSFLRDHHENVDSSAQDVFLKSVWKILRLSV